MSDYVRIFYILYINIQVSHFQDTVNSVL